MKLTILALTAAGFAVANAQYGCNVDTVTCCINSYRAKYGLKPLGVDTRICRASLLHSQDMASRHVLDHKGANGNSGGDRMHSQGVNCGAWAENIADGQKTEAAVCAAWIASPGHRRNIVGDYDGVCTARYGDYWTQDFAKYNGQNPSSPVSCNGAAPVSNTNYQQQQQQPPTGTAPAQGTTYRKVLYRKLLYSNGHYFYQYYYKLIPVYVRSYHDASGDYTPTPSPQYSGQPDSYDLSDVQDVAADYEPSGQYETDTVPYSKCTPTYAN